MGERKGDPPWRSVAEEVFSGVADWRSAHPTATLSEIEQEVDARLDVLRTKMLEDAAMASAMSDIGKLPVEWRPSCPACDGRLEARGQEEREVQTMRGKAVKLRRSYTVCGSCGAGLFPPR